MKLGKKICGLLMGAVVATTTMLPATAKEIKASQASEDYARLLQYSLYFYDANMCGTDVASSTKLSWRDNCHVQDDVLGGFHDAGDHVMFGLPQGYTASTLGWSYYEFKDAYDSLGETSHLRTITDYFAKFFREATVLDSNGNVVKFCYEKGNGDVDHSYWGTPEKQESQQGKRESLWASSGSGDIAAEYAASLAVNYINFGNEEDLKYAKALYDYAIKNQSTTSRAPFYNSSNCDDDIAWAAGWLYIATEDSKYRDKPVNIYPGWFFNWDNVTVGAAILGAHISGDWSKVRNFLNQECNSSDYKFVLQWGSARYNTGLQMCALVYDKCNGGNTSYGTWAKNQMEYITGDKAFNNGKKQCLVVGFNDNSSKYPHHRGASGYQNVGIDGYTGYDANNGKTLYGALVGGPTDSNGTYVDSVADYTANEVALDYNAGFVGAAAGLYDKYKTGSTIDMSAFKEIKAITPPVEGESVLGDVNRDGVIDVADAVLVKQKIASISGISIDEVAADVDKNGKIDVTDAVLIMQHIVGIVSEFK